jgi:hypothetical protein
MDTPDHDEFAGNLPCVCGSNHTYYDSYTASLCIRRNANTKGRGNSCINLYKAF